MANKSEAHPARPERNLVLTRIIDAPRELVFKAWTDPGQMARWWGPKGFTNPVCEVDAKPGGALRIVMRAPDGAEYPMKGVFQEVVEPERLVFTNIAVDNQGNHILEGLTTVTFAEHDGKTKLTLQTNAVAVVGYAAQYLEGMEAGWTQSLERLEELVTITADREIVVTRVFDAAPERVFDAWLDPNTAGKWLFATKAGEMVRVEIDARVGGRFIFVDRRNGEDVEHTGEYLEIDRPRRLVFTFSVPKYSAAATRVMIEVAPHGSGCELKLTHEGVLPDWVEATSSGWTSILGGLAANLVKHPEEK
jgi:uncharacterized protein YndB with AHSA1/START domain